MINYIIVKYVIDFINIYFVGMLVGGFMVNVMVIVYFDVFKVVGIYLVGSNVYVVDFIIVGEVMLYGFLNFEFDGDEVYKKMGFYVWFVFIIMFYG